MGSSSSPNVTKTGSNFPGVQIAVEYFSVSLLLAPRRDLRRRPVRQLKRLAQSISDFGFLNPVLVDDELRIVAGSGRVEAAKMLGMTTVPAIRIEHLTEAQRRLFAIADNVTPEGVEWKQNELVLELKEIELLEPQIELTSSGLSIAQIDTMFGRARTEELAEADDALPDPPAEAVNEVGDMWQLGRHRFACGDARNPAILAALMEGRQARLFLSDPPWNLKIEGVVSGKGKNKHRDFVLGAGEMSRSEFVSFLNDSIAAVQPILMDGALLYLFMDWRNLDALTEAALARKLEQKNLLVWCKDNAGLGLLYRSQHELIALFKHGAQPHLNNIRMGQEGRNRSNVLFYPGANSFVKGRTEALAAHPTSKPVALLADLILDVTAPGDMIVDTFGGSGSTLIAAERMDRVCSMAELHPPYADGIIRRFEALTGIEAVHIGSGLSFAALAVERRSSPTVKETGDGE